MKKKFFTILLSFLLTLPLFGCGKYTPPSGGTPPENPGGPEEPNPPNPTGEKFTVSLQYEQQPYRPQNNITVYWSDNVGLPVSAYVNREGKAEITGLDGDYKVTLSGLPEEYTYNPNVYIATNDKPDVTIELFKVTSTKRLPGSGTGLYTPIQLTETGVYSFTQKDSRSKVHFTFSPYEPGDYVVESWVETSANEINPKADIYVGSAAIWTFSHTQDGGGPSSTFTKNFRHEFAVPKEGISSGGRMATQFVIYADCRADQFPVTMQFRVYSRGDYELEVGTAEVVLPEEAFVKTPNVNQELHAWKFIGDLNGGLLDGNMVRFDESPEYNCYRLWNSRDGFQEILFAKISAPTDVFDAPFNTVEYQGNKALTCAGKNYKVFIEGYKGILSQNESTATGIYKDYEGIDGYAQYTNDDGVYKVTAELQIFLQAYAQQAFLFNDGDGLAESGEVGYVSSEENQWLFACGFYEGYSW
jgi:hypothetical protein